jgi:hypothetical protein
MMFWPSHISRALLLPAEIDRILIRLFQSEVPMTIKDKNCLLARAIETDCLAVVRLISDTGGFDVERVLDYRGRRALHIALIHKVKQP